MRISDRDSGRANHRDLASRLENGARGAQPALEQVAGLHRMGLRLERIGRLAVPAGIERRVHDQIIVAVVFKPSGATPLALKRDIGFDHASAGRQMGVFGKQERAAGTNRP